MAFLVLSWGGFSELVSKQTFMEYLSSAMYWGLKTCLWWEKTHIVSNTSVFSFCFVMTKYLSKNHLRRGLYWLKGQRVRLSHLAPWLEECGKRDLFMGTGRMGAGDRRHPRTYLS